VAPLRALTSTCPVCGRPGSCCAERDRLREALTDIASYHEHGKFSAVTPAVLARKAQRALDPEAGKGRP
jgi:hypothetical protein